jgi:hypothetical protein
MERPMRQKIFLFLAGLAYRRPKTVICLWLFAAAAGLYLASQLEMKTGRVDLLSPGHPHVRNYNDFIREFGTANNIFFIIESPSLQRSKLCADALAAEIEKHPRYIRDALYKFDYDVVENKLLLHLSHEQVGAIEQYLDENAQFLEKLVSSKTLSDVFPTIGELAGKRAKNKFRHPAAATETQALAALLEIMNSYMEGQAPGELSFLSLIAADTLPFDVSGDPDGYLVGRNNQAVVLLARPNAEEEDEFEFLKPMMAALLDAREKTLQDFPDVSIKFTGLPTFAYGDLRVMEEEMPLLFLLALLATVIIFFLFFRHPLEILFSGIALLLALACTLGTAKILIGRLNIMSSVFAITLVSLGIDFGVHFIARLHNESERTGDLHDAMRKTFLGAGPPIATGAFTTAAAFFVLFFTDFRGLAELGVIAGSGILFCLAAMLTALPSLVVLRHRARPAVRMARKQTEALLDRMLDRFASVSARHAGAVIAIFVVGTLFFCYFAPQVSFDYNFLHIQPKNSTTGDYEEVLMERTGLSPSFAAIIDDDLQSLKEKVDRLAHLPSVARIDAATDLVPLDQQDKATDIRRVREKIILLAERQNKNHDPVDLGLIREQFEVMGEGLGAALAMKAVIPDKRIVQQMEKARKETQKFLRLSRLINGEELAQKLQNFSDDLFALMERQLAVLSDKRQLEEVKFEDYPRNIHTRFVGETGKYAAYIYPSQSIWNKDFLDHFNSDILAVDPNATGTTLFAQSLLEISEGALRQSALLVAVAIAALVLLDFRRLLPAALSLLPVGLGLVWMLGVMKVLGWQYNPVNVMAVPIILGIGIDSGVHIVHRFSDSGGDARTALLTSGRAVMVSSLTTIAGFACLLLSTHRGLISLAQLLVLGMSACLMTSLIVLPAILSSLGLSLKGPLPK